MNSCSTKWGGYCGSIRRAVEYALSNEDRVLVVTQPYVSDTHVEQQTQLAGLLGSHYGFDPRVRHVNLVRSVDLRDIELTSDGIHLTAEGNRRVAAALVEPAVALARLIQPGIGLGFVFHRPASLV